MNRSLKLFASLWALVSAGFVQAAADPAPVLPVISITQVVAEDSEAYAAHVAKVNVAMKAKFGVDPFLRVYLADAAGTDVGAVFAVSRGTTFAELLKNANGYQTDPALAELRAGFNKIRKLESRMVLKAVRFDGVNPAAWLYNTYAAVNDEAGYTKALGELRALFDSHGLTDVKINAYRVIAGRSNYTHLVSLNAPSSDRLAAMLDAVATEAWAMEWIAASAKFRTVVHNGTYREISR